ncbi:MliC family protein [Pseudomonas sp. HR96]|uniref:MliC family protein n=1 Tax=Pseudomonas sp. HR96 TaxID=1027966 RepID=UPI002A763899|nr:MliC family protein [Pseudomonas sp. HR96]WPP00261.1 MliC family protein [Pseudomonas sp. HR96]
MKRWMPLLAAGVLSSGCVGIGFNIGGNSQAPADTPWTHWVCDTQASVLWRFTDAAKSRVDVRLEPKEQVYHLKAEPGADGQLYSDGVLALHVQGNDGQPGGLVYWVATNDLIGRGCKAP